MQQYGKPSGASLPRNPTRSFWSPSRQTWKEQGPWLRAWEPSGSPYGASHTPTNDGRWFVPFQMWRRRSPSSRMTMCSGRPSYSHGFWHPWRTTPMVLLAPTSGSAVQNTRLFRNASTAISTLCTWKGGISTVHRACIWMADCPVCPVELLHIGVV